uniref:Piwi domain-containing protein n=1 Tax=Caenorhabditis tropicalis TaxID=1561998 RepID=A0A1I7TPB3_9PELO
MLRRRIFEGRRQGIQFDVPRDRWMIVNTSPDDAFTTRNIMKKSIEKKTTIVIGIVLEKRPEIHDVLEYYEEKLGMQTVQITVDTARKFFGGGGRQTIENVLRKVNPKCGGTNFYVEIQSALQNGTFDGEPTVVEVPYLLKHSTQLGGFSYIDCRAHKLTRLEEKFGICIEAYLKATIVVSFFEIK